MLKKSIATTLAGIRSALRYTPIARAYHTYRDRQETDRWIRGDRPGPAPHSVKRQVVTDYGRQYALTVLVETGTYVGLMLRAQRSHFRRLVSIELDRRLAALNRWQFRREIASGQVELREGDSAEQLPFVLKDLREPALFWLDAHYSGGPTARAKLDTPIVRELSLVLSHNHSRNHVILVDDAHEFTGSRGYPSIHELRATVASMSPAHAVSVEDNVIRIVPRNHS